MKTPSNVSHALRQPKAVKRPLCISANRNPSLGKLQGEPFCKKILPALLSKKGAREKLLARKSVPGVLLPKMSFRYNSRSKRLTEPVVASRPDPLTSWTFRMHLQTERSEARSSQKKPLLNFLAKKLPLVSRAILQSPSLVSCPVAGTIHSTALRSEQLHFSAIKAPLEDYLPILAVQQN